MAAFTNIMGRPRMIKLLIALEDTDTIKWLDFSADITTSR